MTKSSKTVHTSSTQQDSISDLGQNDSPLKKKISMSLWYGSSTTPSRKSSGMKKPLKTSATLWDDLSKLQKSPKPGVIQHTPACVFIWTSQKPFSNAINLCYQDKEWVQTLDYEHIPFRCRWCHEHGHLFRDCPLNAQNKKKYQTDEGFKKVHTWKNSQYNHNHQMANRGLKSQNPFGALSQEVKEISPL